MNVSQLRSRIDAVPRYPLAHRPTPLEHLPRFSRSIGGPQIYIKRDDCTGFALGGNKARHNEFILARALAEGADLFVWGGGVQSNNCRQTAAACAKAGIGCHLVLTQAAGDDPFPPQGNFLLDQLAGASYELTDVGVGQALEARIIEAARRFEAQGRKVFRWNRPVVTPLAAISYVECLAEIVEQSRTMGFVPDAIYVSSGGSTGAGLALGAHVLEQPFAVRSIAYVRWEWDTPADMASMANSAAELLAIPQRLSHNDIDVTFDHVAPGYGKLTPECAEAILLAARTEGLFLDPVYTGKAMAALIDDVRKGRLAAARHVVFVHTGGTPALFAYGGELAAQMSARAFPVAAP